MTENLFIVRLYDGFDAVWMDICSPCSYEEAQKIWNEKTGNGQHNTKYSDIDYYRMFPADTVMRFSGEPSAPPMPYLAPS